MEETPENGKESPHSAHANGMNVYILYGSTVKVLFIYVVCVKI